MQNTITRFLCSTEEHDALKENYLMKYIWDYSRFNDPTWGFNGSEGYWVVYIKGSISPTMLFNMGTMAGKRMERASQGIPF